MPLDNCFYHKYLVSNITWMKKIIGTNKFSENSDTWPKSNKYVITNATGQLMWTWLIWKIGEHTCYHLGKFD